MIEGTSQPFSIVEPAKMTPQQQQYIEQLRLYVEMQDVLANDVLQVRHQQESLDSPFWRRSLIRTVFAMVEAENYQRKQMALLQHTHGHVKFSNAELALLRDEDYDLKASGEANTRTKFVRVPENTLFSFRMTAKGFAFPFEVDRGGQGWPSFRESVQVRNRITHPKGLTHLGVSDHDMVALGTGMDWYKDVSQCFLKLVQRHALARYA